VILTWFTLPARSWTWFGQTGETLALITQGGASAVATVVGPPGPSGAAAGKFIFTQVSPATLWTVAHNLGSKPSVTTLSVGSVELEAQVAHLSSNTLTITFNAAQAGSAICQ